ncbi:histidine kinase [Streptomyces sp. ID03-2B]|uniref:sensor histidine kinase n=1 Tax=Streptomyces sp. st115 TaxID=1828047 RepID=UPI001180D726|nr:MULTISPECIES: histidine kinase [unclassified Streptomyces]MDX3591467.1 histidine kinase [Streptomyces sp. ID03-2B]
MRAVRPLNRLPRPERPDVLITLAVALPVGGWTLLLLALALPGAWALLLAPAVLVGHAAGAWRRSAATASFTVTTVACAVQAVVLPGEFPLLPSLLAFPLALYAYCAHGPGRAPLASVLVGAAGAAAVTLRSALTTTVQLPPAFLFGFLLAIVLVAFSLGLFRRFQLAYVGELEHRAVRAEAEREERAARAARDERARIAREMHDLVAHSLSVIVSQAQGGRYAARARPERAAEVLATVEEAGRQALTDMRGLLGMLRGGDHGDGFGPQPDLAQVPELLRRVRESGLTVDYTETGEPGRLTPAAELAAYRLVQEALTNTLKHAGPGARCGIRFDWSDYEVEIQVRDDGTGPGPGDGAGHGLVGMRERAAVAGGTVHTGPAPGGGFLVSARLPVRAAAGSAGPENSEQESGGQERV